MRALAQPEVIRKAAIAASLSALVSFPRLANWSGRHYPLWYLEALLFLGGMVLWAFVFAWHTRYSGSTVFTAKLSARDFLVATIAGVAMAVGTSAFLDARLRALTPEDYPATFDQWLAMTLFSLAFTQLFLVFAPFAWLLRLSHSRFVAIGFTVLFGVMVLLIKNHRSGVSLPSGLMAGLVIARIMSGFIALHLYLRGGVLLVWWCGLLLQGRLLIGMDVNAYSSH